MAISGSPVSANRARFRLRIASTRLACRCRLIPAGLARFRMGSPLLKKGIPWWMVGRKPLSQLETPARGPCRPDWRTTKAGRSWDSVPRP